MAKLIADAKTDEILNNLAKGATIASGSRYFALFDGDPQGAGTEQTSTITGSATRLQVDGRFGTPTTVNGFRQIANNATLTVTGSASGAANATYAAIYDAATGGNLIASYTLSAALSIAAGNAVEFASGQVTLAFDNPA